MVVSQWYNQVLKNISPWETIIFLMEIVVRSFPLFLSHWWWLVQLDTRTILEGSFSTPMAIYSFWHVYCCISMISLTVHNKIRLSTFYFGWYQSTVSRASYVEEQTGCTASDISSVAQLGRVQISVSEIYFWRITFSYHLTPQILLPSQTQSLHVHLWIWF